MICLLLIMTMIFISSSESAEQKLRHSDTLLKEEDTNAKTKAWLLMVESGKVDQEELRRITPKSIFIAPLLTGRAGKCKEGYRHDHLGQCVKVIKIDPQAQLELLLDKLNKLYGEKKEEKEGGKEDFFEVSSGPLHFSLPISSADERPAQTASGVKAGPRQDPSEGTNATAAEGQSVPDLIPIPPPPTMAFRNKTNQTKEMEASGAEPLTETDAYDGSSTRIEGSGGGPAASGDGFPEEESTTPAQVGFLPEEGDYFDATQPDPTTSTEVPDATEPADEDLHAAQAAIKEAPLKESYHVDANVSSVNNVNTSTADTSKESAREETPVKNKFDSDRIYFPGDEGYDPRSATTPPAHGGRIRFPDEEDQRQLSSYLPPPDSSTKSSKHHSSAIPREQFWWLPKNWQIDETHHKSTLVKVWSRLPLIHDITHPRDAAEATRTPPLPDERPPAQRPPSARLVKPFKSSRFQDILTAPRQNFRFQR